MKNTVVRIYFAIKTEHKALDEDFFKQELSIKPTSFQQMNKNGKPPFCTLWEYSTKEFINPNCSDETTLLVQKLIPYKDEFLNLKRKHNDIEMVLQIVIYLGDEQPALSFSKKVLRFINAIEATIDCDIYNNK